MFAVLFGGARLILLLPTVEDFNLAVARLKPFEVESEHTADEYAAVAQSIQGTEMSLASAQEVGLLDEDGYPTPLLLALYTAP